MTERVITLIDMDCFYCQVETRLNPQLQGLPLAVVQYNEWKGGGIIAVNYEARDKGVTRYMRGAEAKEQCPEIVLVKVPTIRDKADLSRYRDAGREVVSVLCTFSECVERASVDEAYIDLTAAVNKRIVEKSSLQLSENDLANTFIVGYTKEGSNREDERVSGLRSWVNDIYDSSFQDVAAQKLAVGAAIVEEMRKAVYDATGFKCSAGIAHNKILAKLACGLHKPNRQTIIPQTSVPNLFKGLPVKKVRSLGGKLGDDLMERLGVKVMEDLLKFSENELQKKYDSKTGSWLYNMARGFDSDPVTARLISKSIGCCKRFPGRSALCTSEDIHLWIGKLSVDLLERLNEDQSMNKRRAQLLTVSLTLEVNSKDVASSKSCHLTSYNLEKLVAAVASAVKKYCVEDSSTKKWSPPIKQLGLSAGKFQMETSNKIMNFFKTTPDSCNKSKIIKDSIAENPSPIMKFKNSENPLPELLDNEVSNSKKNLKETPVEKAKVIQSDEIKQPSFFEKLLFQRHAGNEVKLNLLPDFNKFEGLNDGEHSQDSTVAEKLTHCNNIKDKNEIKSPEKQVCLGNNRPINFNGSPDINKEDKEPLKLNSTKINKNSISSYFSKSMVKEKWINPEEIFPDLTNIDDDVVNMFPSSFKKKILELKLEKAKETEKSASSSVTDNHENSVHTSESNHELPEKSSCSNSETDNGVLSPNELMENTSQPDYVKCVECNERVSIEEQTLHLDLHMAMKLDKELNPREVSPTFSDKSKQISKNTLSKKKRKIKTSGTKFESNKKVKGIEAFFIK